MSTLSKTDTLKGILTEMGAGKSFSQSPEARVWNDAHDRCISIVRNYLEGNGLFQMTARIKRHPTTKHRLAGSGAEHPSPGSGGLG